MDTVFKIIELKINCIFHKSKLNMLPPRMNFSKIFLSKLTALISSSTYAQGAEVVEASASVPEPSIAILGGICGILFLIWRKK